MSVVYKPCCFLFSKFQKKEVCFSKLIFWCRIIRYYWNIFPWWSRYSTMNITTMILFFASVWIKQRRVWRFSIMVVLLMLTIFCGLMKWLLLVSTIILCGAVYLLLIPIKFWIFSWYWFGLMFMNIQKWISNNIIVRKK